MSTVRIQLRRGLSSEWTSVNPTLAAGEVGIETDTNTLKFGDGTTAWNSLDYALSNTVDDFQPISEKGNAGGYASLDGSGYVPLSQLPPTVKITVNAVANQAARLALSVQAGDIAIQADNGTTYVLSQTPATTSSNWKEISATAEISAAVTAHEADTTNVHGIADTAALATKTYADAAVGAHEADTTSIHGIADTAALATKTYADNKASDAVGTAAAALAAHEADTTNIHGIADTSALVTLNANQTLTAKTLTSPALTGTPTAPTATVGTDTTQVATTAFVQDAIELVVGAAPAALNTLAEIATSLADNADLSGTLTTAISGKVAKSGDTMSGVLNMGTNKITSVGTATTDYDAANKFYVDSRVTDSVANHRALTSGVHGIADTAALALTADVNSALDLKANIASPTFTGTVILPVGTVTSGMIADGTIVDADINGGAAIAQSKISGLTASLDLKANLASPTFTGTVGGVTKSMVGLANVDNTTDAGKPISTATQTALDLKANLASPTFTGTVTLPAGTVTSGMIADGAVATADIADAAVTTAKILDANVTTAKINDSAVTSGKIAALAVTEGKLADGAVTSGKIADGTVVDADVSAVAAIAQSKISGLTSDLALKAPLASPTFTGTVTLPVGTVTSGMIADGTIVDADVSATAAIATSKISGLDTALAAKLASTTAASTYAPLASPALTGTPTAPTATAGTATTQVATTAFVGTAVSNLVASSPAALDTLNELATALGNDASFSTTITNALAAKAPLASPALTGTATAVNLTVTGTSNMSANGVQFSDGTQTKEGVPSRTTTTTTVSGAYNLSTGGLTLRDQLINVAGAFAITIPTNTTTAFPVGTSISFWQSSGAGGASFVPADGTVSVYATPGATLRALYSSATITKVGANAWIVAGDLKA